MNPLDVENEAEGAAAVAGTTIRKRLLLQELRHVLSLVGGHHCNHKGEGDVEPSTEYGSVRHAYLTDPARRPWTK